MANTHYSKIDPDETTVYQIKVKGHLSLELADWFGSVTIRLEDNGDTLLTCRVVDQAALYGVLRMVRDLGMPLISVNRIEPDQAQPSSVKQ